MLSGKSWGVIFSGKLILRKIIKIVATRCHFNAKMHKIRFWLGLRLRLNSGSFPYPPPVRQGGEGKLLPGAECDGCLCSACYGGGLPMTSIVVHKI